MNFRHLRMRQLEQVALVILIFSCILFLLHNISSPGRPNQELPSALPQSKKLKSFPPDAAAVVADVRSDGGEPQCDCQCRCSLGDGKQTVYFDSHQKLGLSENQPPQHQQQGDWHRDKDEPGLLAGELQHGDGVEERRLSPEEEAREHVLLQSDDDDTVTSNSVREDLYKQMKKFEFNAPKRRVPAPASFVAGQPRMVIILGYQRSGSSFLGSALFNDNPNIFYLYEPLDALYTAMYGVVPGWTVPSEITAYRENGSLRDPPRRELQAVSWYLEKLLTCDVSSLPYEVYTHKFWKDHLGTMRTTKPYVDCITKQGLLGLSCHEHIDALCGTRFGMRDHKIKQEACADYLWEKKQPQSDHIKMFNAYNNCTEQQKAKLKPCLPKFSEPCEIRQLRALKTVRATMASMEELLLKYQNLRVIHLYRDPRSVVLSRLRLYWPLGNYERTHPGPVAVAKLYCQTVLHDYRTRLRLEKKFPGRILEVVYDNFIKEPLISAEEVYTFLDAMLPPDIRKKLSKVKYKWVDSPINLMQKYLISNDLDKIKEECKEFAEVLGVRWSST